ncbi:MAG TPA: hypothetical protein VNL98_03005 [Gemmatimonadales bacterium]|nr:hypothetical protein [Gemmatimonadales bacterium]
MVWAVILVALLIPLAAVVLDSPVVRAFIERRAGFGGGGSEPAADLRELTQKVSVLESELEALSRQLADMQEEHQFIQRLLEDPAVRQAAAERLPPPRS